MTATRVGVIGTSRKENEQRVGIHPAHLDRLPTPLRQRLHFEHGYGEGFGVTDDELGKRAGGVASRRELLAESQVVILPKPMPEDLLEMREGGVLWGWPHCVQQRAVTQAAIDRRLTLIAFEAMFHWSGAGLKGLHTLYRNNELAGYCAVLHALHLAGFDGNYGPERRAVVLGFGSVSRGAAYALQGLGIQDRTFYTQRPPHLVADQLPACAYRQMRRDGERTLAVAPDGEEVPLVERLAEADVIVNGTLQDPENPLMYLRAGEVDRLRPGSLIVDVSCDEGMGFPFARPTSFEEPSFAAGGALYYAVDHTPSYLWASSSWEISAAIVPYLPAVAGGPEAWANEPTLEHAIEIRDGVIVNQAIARFQGRDPDYPHEVRENS
jgi:alanine dehydrogenase